MAREECICRCIDPPALHFYGNVYSLDMSPLLDFGLMMRKTIDLLPRQAQSMIFDAMLKFNWFIHQKEMLNTFEEYFSEKDIAIIGSAPTLFGSNQGANIDRHQVCVRINFPRNDGMQSDRGSRTDVIFAGANFGTVPDEFRQESGWQGSTIFSGSYNKKYFSSTISKDIFYLPMSAIQATLEKTEKQFHFERKIVGGPPRSGAMFILFLLFYADSARIKIYGFSTERKSAMSTISPGSVISNYDEAKLLGAHCDPDEEIKLLKKLWNRGLISWFEMEDARS